MYCHLLLFFSCVDFNICIIANLLEHVCLLIWGLFFIYMLVKKYHLTPSEYQILWNSISHYINTIHSYQIIDVGLAGRTIDKIEKIKKYQLDQDDIKESYLFALSFDKKLSQRSDLLRSFLMKKGSDIQEVQKSLKNTLTEKEFSAIQKIKAEMNQTIQKVKKLKL